MSLASAKNQLDQLARLDALVAGQISSVTGLSTEVTQLLVKAALEANGGKLDTLHADLLPLLTQATGEAIETELLAQGVTLDSLLTNGGDILTALGPLATGANVATVETAVLAGNASLSTIATRIGDQATAAKQDALKAVVDGMATSLADIDTNTDDLETIAAATRDRLGAAPGAPYVNAGADVSDTIKNAPGRLYSLAFANYSGVTLWLWLFDSATASGTQLHAPLLVPTNTDRIVGQDHFTLPGIPFATALTFGFSTSRTAYAAHTTAADVDLSAVYV